MSHLSARPARPARRRLLPAAAAVLVAAAGALTAPGTAAAAPAVPTPQIAQFSMLHTVPAGTSTTVTVTLTAPLDATPDFVRISDVTNGLYHNCNTGSVCSWTAGFPSGVHEFTAHLDSGKNGPAPYPVLIATAPEFITWSSAGFTVSLGYNAARYQVATANQDVTTTPYYIQFYDADTGARSFSCPSGSSCVNPAPPTAGNVVAAIGSSSTTFPPATIVATSQTLQSFRIDAATGRPANRRPAVDR